MPSNSTIRVLPTAGAPEPLYTVSSATLDDIRRFPEWRSTFSSIRKDHRYYEILDEALRDRFDYGYLVVRDANDAVCAIQPYFVVEQDYLEDVGLDSPSFRLLRRMFSWLLKQRTLMVGCVAGEGHLAQSHCLSPAEIAELTADNLPALARSLNARMIVMKEFPARYRPAMSIFQSRGFTRIPSMPMTTMDIRHASFDEYVAKGLRANARRHLRKNLAATRDVSLEMEVTDDVTPMLDEVYGLYLQVFGRAKLRFEKLSPDYFRLLSERMADTVRYFTWRLDGRLVAFSMSMVEGKTLYLEYLGLDYSVALDMHLYYATFRDQYDWAARNGFEQIKSSGLGYDPKLHLKYRLLPIDLYVRHVSPLVNVMVGKFLPRVGPVRFDPTLQKFENYDELW